MQKKIMLPVLDDRLLLIASMVRNGSVPLDVGTDHAYIPVYLIKNGICDRAVASDVNSGPLGRAVENARRFGVADKIMFYRADGIPDTCPEKNSVTDIIIAGMGGELISRIISESDYTRIPGVRLILQPMSAIQELRGYLAEMGYETVDEKLCKVGDKYYTVISAEYDGVRREVTPMTMEIGSIDTEAAEPLVNGFLNSVAEKLKRRIEGRKKGELDTSADEELLREIKEMAMSRGYKID